MNKFFIVLATLLLVSYIGESKYSLSKYASQKMSQMLFAKYSDEYDKSMKDFLTSLKSLLKTGDASLNIPPLDPLVIDKSFNINNPQLRLKGEFQAEIRNLSNYVINNVHADLDLNTVLNITLNDVTMMGHYSLDGMSMNLIPIIGAGNHYLHFKTLNLAVIPQFLVKNGYIKMFSSGLEFNEKDFEFIIDGLLDQADLSKVLKFFLRDLMSSLLSHNVQLSKVLNNNLVSAFNGADDKGKDIYDIIDTVKSVSGS